MVQTNCNRNEYNTVSEAQDPEICQHADIVVYGYDIEHLSTLTFALGYRFQAVVQSPRQMHQGSKTTRPSMKSEANASYHYAASAWEKYGLSATRFACRVMHADNRCFTTEIFMDRKESKKLWFKCTEFLVYSLCITVLFSTLGTRHERQLLLNCGYSSVFASWRKRTVDFCFHLKKRCLVSWFLFFSHVSIFIFKLIKFYLSVYMLQLVVFYIAIYSVFRMLNVVVITKYIITTYHMSNDILRNN